MNGYEYTMVFIFIRQWDVVSYEHPTVLLMVCIHNMLYSSTRPYLGFIVSEPISIIKNKQVYFFGTFMFTKPSISDWNI